VVTVIDRFNALEIVSGLHTTALQLEQLLSEAHKRVVAVEQLVAVARFNWKDYCPPQELSKLAGVGADVERLEAAIDNWRQAITALNAEFELRWAADAADELEQALETLRRWLRTDA
jgi:hypothetical protein